MYYKLPENITPLSVCLNNLAAHIVSESINDDEDIQEITAQYLSCLHDEIELLIEGWKYSITAEIELKASKMQEDLAEWVDNALNREI